MSNSQTRPEPSKLTPKELAEKCRKLWEDVVERSKTDNPEDNWAKEAVELGEEFHKDDPLKCDSLCLPLRTSDIKKNLPELWEQVIEPAIKIANKKGDMYKAPEAPAYIVLGDDSINGFYKDLHHAIGLGIDYIASKESIDEIISIVSHEWGHAYEKLFKRVSFGFVSEEKLLEEHPENAKKSFAKEPLFRHKQEYNCDRYSLTRQSISDNLSIIIENKKNYDYDDAKRSHPNYRKRTKMLLAEMLGNELFGMNGLKSIDYEGNVEFIPNHSRNSTEYVQNKIRKKIGYDRTPPESDIGITEDGRLVRNYNSLDLKINQKANELIEKLDPLVESGLNLAKKSEWLELVDREVAEFREKNKPEFVDGKEIPLGGWLSRITLESCSSHHNQGRK